MNKKVWIGIAAIVVVAGIALGIVWGKSSSGHQVYTSPKVPSLIIWCGSRDDGDVGKAPNLGDVTIIEKDGVTYIENNNVFVVKPDSGGKWTWGMWGKAGAEDVLITSAVFDTYNGDFFLSQTPPMDMKLDGGRLAAYSIWGANAGWPAQSMTHAVFVVKGATVSGKSLQATNRVDFSK